MLSKLLTERWLGLSFHGPGHTIRMGKTAPHQTRYSECRKAKTRWSEDHCSAAQRPSSAAAAALSDSELLETGSRPPSAAAPRSAAPRAAIVNLESQPRRVSSEG